MKKENTSVSFKIIMLIVIFSARFNLRMLRLHLGHLDKVKKKNDLFNKVLFSLK